MRLWNWRIETILENHQNNEYLFLFVILWKELRNVVISHRAYIYPIHIKNIKYLPWNIETINLHRQLLIYSKKKYGHGTRAWNNKLMKNVRNFFHLSVLAHRNIQGLKQIKISLWIWLVMDQSVINNWKTDALTH